MSDCFQRPEDVHAQDKLVVLPWLYRTNTLRLQRIFTLTDICQHGYLYNPTLCRSYRDSSSTAVVSNSATHLGGFCIQQHNSVQMRFRYAELQPRPHGLPKGILHVQEMPRVLTFHQPNCRPNHHTRWCCSNIQPTAGLGLHEQEPVQQPAEAAMCSTQD